jgi:murein L,D-transpeptidase YcbB/YkuD
MNPIYVSLRRVLAEHRGRADEALIGANLERARGLPPDLGKRYILVDPAAQTLWWYDAGAARGSMKVVVGRDDNQTPSMIGVVRYALYNPYWNVPPDLVRDEIAPAVLRQGPGYLAGKHLDALADFSTQSPRLAPAEIDWRSVASGAETLRMRQAPGPANMMGEVKFMLPNPLGIYLHDTPSKGLFGAQVRTDSHGCVRLQHAQELADWLWGRPPHPAAGPDSRVDLAAPVPVYIVYLTVLPGAGGLTVLPDVYGRDPVLQTQIAERNGAQERPGLELLSWTAARPPFPY